MSIVRCTMNELEEASKFAYEKNQNIEYRCRPFLLNEPLESIKEAYKRHIETDFFDVLLQYDSDKLVGVTGVYWLVEDSYISITRGLFAEKDYSIVANRFLDYFKANYKGYKFYINTAKEHKKSIAFYSENGFELLEDAVLYNLHDLSNGSISDGIELLNSKNQDEIYSDLARFMTEDTYWNVERLKSCPDKFIIMGYFQDGIKGTILAQIYRDNSIEICGLEALNVNIKKILLNALAKVADEKNVPKIMLYTEEDDDVKLGVELGYQYYDSNVCFLKTL